MQSSTEPTTIRRPTAPTPATREGSRAAVRHAAAKSGPGVADEPGRGASTAARVHAAASPAAEPEAQAPHHPKAAADPQSACDEDCTIRTAPRRAPSLPASAFDDMSVGVVWLDEHCRVRGLNAAAEMHLGVSRRRARGTPFHELLGLPEPLTRSHPPAEAMGLRNVQLNPPRSKAFLADVVLTPTDIDETPGLLVELLPLDRARRIAEDEQSERQQQLSREILRGLAHEVKNPLGGMRGAAQLLQVELAGSPLAEYTAIVLREVDRLVAMVDRMLGPNQAPNRTRINIHEVAERVLSLVRLELPEGIRVVRNYDPSIPDVLADRDMLIQATLNLVRNAVQAMGGEGRLTLATRVLRHHTVHGVRHRLVALLRVGDDGPGVAEHLRDRIFFPMVSGRADGSGLGLSIAQRLVQLNGGVIEFRSRPRRTEFDLLIPIPTSTSADSTQEAHP